MRSWISILLFCLLFSNYLAAQDAVEDSLNSVLLKSAEDTNKVKTYFELIKRVRKYDLAEALKLAEEQLTLSKKIGYGWGIGKAHNAKGLIATSKKEADLAIEEYLQAAKAFNEIKDFGDFSGSYTNISMVFSDVSIFMNINEKLRNDSAIYFAKIAAKYNEMSNVDSTKKINNEMFIYGNLSAAYYNLNLHDSAIVYNNKSIEVAEKLGRWDVVGTCYISMGALFFLQKNHDQAIYYYLKAIPIFEKEKWAGLVAKAESDLAVVYFNKGDIAHSREYINESSRGALLLNDSGTISQNYWTKGLIELSENKYESAINNFESGLKITAKTKNTQIESELWKSCAEAYAKIHNYDKAISMYNKSLEFSVGNYNTTYECYEALANIYASKKNYEKAYNYLNESRILNSKLFDSTKSQIINELTIKYETGKKNQEIELLNKDREIQKAEAGKQKTIKSILIAGTLMLIAFSFTGFVFYKRKRDAILKKKEAELNAHITEVEMKALRSQMNPHFIFNSLRSIDEYIKHNQSTLASEYLVKFAKLMRAILENSRKKEITISKDFEALELYMQLESKRLEHPLNYSIDIDPKIDPQNILIPPMLLQPIVENSIWHGIAPKGSPGKIKIRLTKSNDIIRCEVEDNGIGRKNSKSESNDSTNSVESYGLKITEERLSIISEVKKIFTTLVFRDLSEDTNSTGLNVSFVLPYEENI